jgi:hypothetical protein
MPVFVALVSRFRQNGSLRLRTTTHVVQFRARSRMRAAQSQPSGAGMAATKLFAAMLR